MNDQAAKYLKLLKTHIDRVVVGAVYVLLGIMVWFWYSEETTSSEEAQPKVAQFVDPVEKNPSKELLTAAKETPDIAKFPDIEQVRRFNMFDYKTVKQKEEIEKLANDKFRQAQDLATRGQTEEAKRLLKETLDSFPTHKDAKELFDKLSAPQQTPAASGTTPATATPTAAVVP